MISRFLGFRQLRLELVLAKYQNDQLLIDRLFYQKVIYQVLPISLAKQCSFTAQLFRRLLFSFQSLCAVVIDKNATQTGYAYAVLFAVKIDQPMVQFVPSFVFQMTDSVLSHLLEMPSRFVRASSSAALLSLSFAKTLYVP